MNILCTNDDGYDCGGIKELAAALRNAGHRVLILAPDRDRSGTSQSLGMMSAPTLIKQVADDDWICSGTPADCVLSLVSGCIDFAPDAVASGINAGANLGTDIVFSGTCGGARQGSLSGIPSIAFSLASFGPFNFKAAADWAAANFENLIVKLKNFPDSYAGSIPRGLQQWEYFFNINFPPTSDFKDEPVITFPSRRRYFDRCTAIEEKDGWKRLDFSAMQIETDSQHGSDCDVVANNNISLSVVKVQPCTA
jgi:5'-nucleotidase